MRSSGRHSNEMTKSKERKDAGEKKKVRLWKGKKKDEVTKNVEMQTDGVLRSRVLFLDYESYQKSYQKPFSSAGRSPHARSLPTLSANGYLWMHQSTPPLPGFNAIRIDYIDFARGCNLRPRPCKTLGNASMHPLRHPMILRIGRPLNVLSKEYRLPCTSISDLRDALHVFLVDVYYVLTSYTFSLLFLFLCYM